MSNDLNNVQLCNWLRQSDAAKRLCILAADRIEQLAAEVTSLKTQIDNIIQNQPLKVIEKTTVTKLYTHSKVEQHIVRFIFDHQSSNDITSGNLTELYATEIEPELRQSTPYIRVPNHTTPQQVKAIEKYTALPVVIIDMEQL